MKITYLGHAGLSIEAGGNSIIVDPYITANEKAAGLIDPDELQADFILLTHAHNDHILDAERIAKRSGAIIVSNFEITNFYEEKGLEVHPMNHGGQWHFPFGTLKYTQAIHTSSFPDGSYGGQPGGFILTSGGKSIYIAGDTALTMDMQLIPMRVTLDLAILPIGDNFTMGYEDAAIAAEFLNCKEVLGYHYDTFGYIEIDKKKATEHFGRKGKKLILLEIGESLSL